MIFLADIWDHFTNNGIGIFVLGLIGVLVGYAALMAALKGHRDVFGRRPPIDEDLRVYSASVAKLQRDLEKLPDDRKFQELVDRLGTFATVPMVTALGETFHRELKNSDAYAHAEVHRLNGELNGIQLDARERGERLAALEANSETHMRQLDSIDTKIDTIRDQLGIQKGRNL